MLSEGPTAYDGLSRELIPFILEASHRAFGPGGTANVLALPDGSGYEALFGSTTNSLCLDRCCYRERLP